MTIGRKLDRIEKASTFLKLLKDTDASKNLLFSTGGTTTVFVPTNQAFEKLSKERLAALTDPANSSTWNACSPTMRPTTRGSTGMCSGASASYAAAWDSS